MVQRLEYQNVQTSLQEETKSGLGNTLIKPQDCFMLMTPVLDYRAVFSAPVAATRVLAHTHT